MLAIPMALDLVATILLSVGAKFPLLPTLSRISTPAKRQHTAYAADTCSGLHFTDCVRIAECHCFPPFPDIECRFPIQGCW